MSNKGGNKRTLLTEMILEVTEIGEKYSTREIKARLFSWKGSYVGQRLKLIPHTHALPVIIKSSKAFTQQNTNDGTIWTRKEVEA
tara:strand:- start:250 stop:504 length:255 start_codon:yes stop_codon:yes gene_type:complete